MVNINELVAQELVEHNILKSASCGMLDAFPDVHQMMISGNNVSLFPLNSQPVKYVK